MREYLPAVVGNDALRARLGDELARGVVKLKDLGNREERELTLSEAISLLK